MAKLIIENDKCRIEDEDNVPFLWAIDKELSYEVQGAEYTRAYKGYRDYRTGEFVKWDGKNRMLKEDLSFPLGLKQRVVNFYKRHNRDILLEDNRTNKTPSKPIDISNSLKDMNVVPRSYQIDALEAAKNNDIGIIRAATGAGKSLIATLMVAEFGKKSILYVIGTDLLYQFHSFLSKVFKDQKVGIIGDGKCELGEINVVSVWTAGQAFGLDKDKIIYDNESSEKEVSKSKYEEIRNVIKDAKVHIWDECHVCACDTIQTISKNIKPEHIYGMSASPWRDDGSEMLIECILGSKIVDISARSLVEAGWLTKPIIKFKHAPKIKPSSTKYQTIYKECIVENEGRNTLIADSVKRLVELKYKPLVLFNSIKHGRVLYEKLSENNKCILLSGKDSIENRDKAKEDIENGTIDVIIASRIFDVGLDLPVLSALVNCGGGKSSVATLQRVGRVIRKYPGKKFAAIIDFIDDAKHLYDHSKKRRKILETEFEITWG